MTSLADRLMARAADRVSAVQPVIEPLFASRQYEAGVVGARTAGNGAVEAAPASSTGTIGATRVADAQGENARGEPRSTQGARRQTLDEWLAANAPATLTASGTRNVDADQRHSNSAADSAPSVRDSHEHGTHHGPTTASDVRTRGADREHVRSDQMATFVPGEIEAPSDALSKPHRVGVHVVSEPPRRPHVTERLTEHAQQPARVVRQAAAAHDVAPPVQITIGRVVVRALLPSASQPAPPPSAPAAPAGGTLAEYLARRPRP